MNVLEFLLDSIVYLELICAIIGTICFNKYKESYLRFVIYYLWLVCFIEIFSTYFASILNSNIILYNILSIIEFFVFSYIFYKELKIPFFRKVVFTSLTIFFTSLIANIAYVGDPYSKFLNLAFGCSSILLSLYCCFYFYYIARTEKILHLYKMLFTWICIGLLVYHLCSLPITVLSNQLEEINESDSLLSILGLSGMLMYLCFTTGFLWSKKEYNYSLY